MERLTTRNLVDELLKAVPEFEEVYGKGLEGDRDNNYLVFACLTSFLLDTLRNPAADQGCLPKGISFLERVYTSDDPDVVDIVNCEFVEALEDAGPHYSSIRAMLGPKLGARADREFGKNPKFR